ncbi:MAG: YbaB/EbfC family nucleoid-associated protein [Dehalococcoidia bacterium]|jgi:DNA-binding YbaB/EbfC family protein|nr:YbaB/EbfC family nucleoid-associated protein [Dehalococcoidia bacterium]MCK5180958.1 YbaB/EbfC family nucleoid-associated protein [Dehalococcoidia bacterium]
MDKSMLRQAQQLQAKLAKAQEELGSMTVEATSGGGAVKVVIDGHQKVHSVEISPEAVEAGDIELLQDLVMSAVNEAVTKSQELVNKHLSSLTGGLNIPGLL